MSYNVQLIEMLKVGPHHISPFMLILFGMVRDKSASKKGYIAVELGTSCGNSTVAIASGLASTGNGHLFSCDIEECKDAANAIYRAGCREFWTFHQEDSLTAARRVVDNTVDFVFVDSSHEYDQTVKEIQAWAPKLVRGGRMVFHDTCSRPDGVARPIAEFLKVNNWPYYNIDVDCGLGVMTKP